MDDQAAKGIGGILAMDLLDLTEEDREKVFKVVWHVEDDQGNLIRPQAAYIASVMVMWQGDPVRLRRVLDLENWIVSHWGYDVPRVEIRTDKPAY